MHKQTTALRGNLALSSAINLAAECAYCEAVAIYIEDRKLADPTQGTFFMPASNGLLFLLLHVCHETYYFEVVQFNFLFHSFLN